MKNMEELSNRPKKRASKKSQSKRKKKANSPKKSTRKNNSSVREKVKQNRQTTPLKLCLICGRPGHWKALTCTYCSHINRDAAKTVNARGKKLAIYTLKYLMEYVIHSYSRDPVIEWFSHHSSDYWTYIPRVQHKERADHRRKMRQDALARENEEIRADMQAESLTKMPFLQVEFEKQQHMLRRLIGVRGTYMKPQLIVECERCHEDFICLFDDLRVGRIEHDCPETTSSGEIAVKTFLTDLRVDFVTQYATLDCRNPKTGFQLPYDFELTKFKILIEVQGKQHYEFVPYLQQNIETFEYQVWKDKVKADFARERGYLLLAMPYEDIHDGTFKYTIQSAMANFSANHGN
ncbi:MAG: hypothetical protein LKJ29_08675 [Lactobacillus sp.]|uniref:DUF2726 domain-containing protein n=1 Tax=Lacticaseibacillus suilingensis TaxID=2799577 RepID=A0ABW4BGG9_9LACO|nr:hypothetical protein [Lacticaseibacillus suilingensis]MCI1942111.1 hypothetical protein [Lactobacillus sp.]MCI1972426.1 hypothetical protein [Lactobacillus sp.]MCI2017011.1 hypothetical protein [Lactobacillus sp.]